MSSSFTLNNLKLHLLLEQTQDRASIATVLEFPEYKTEASTNEQAIAQLQTLVFERLAKVQVFPMEVPLSASEAVEDPWMKYAGVFKDDPYFAKVVETIEAER
jgi:hypothetical protein